MKLEYFGTSLDSAGHYLWELEGNGCHRSLRQFNALPFNPEGLPYFGNQPRKLGEVQFFNFCGFTIIAIYGSCKDSRPGSKSIFFTEATMSYKKLRQLIQSTLIAQKIISQMDFNIMWPPVD